MVLLNFILQYVSFYLSTQTMKCKMKKLQNRDRCQERKFCRLSKNCDKIAILLYLAYANNISMNHNVVEVRFTP